MLAERAVYSHLQRGQVHVRLDGSRYLGQNARARLILESLPLNYPHVRATRAVQKTCACGFPELGLNTAL